jgi:PAS domain S-box-containing protein
MSGAAVENNLEDEHYLRRELYRLTQSDTQIFEFLQAGSLDGLWYWDLENPEHEWLSPRFKSLFGYEDHEIPHTPDWWQANIHPEDLPRALENFEQHVADPEIPYDQLIRYKHKTGATVWVRCRGIVIRDAEGAPIRMLGAHSDVTALKEAEHTAKAQSDSLAIQNLKLKFLSSVASRDLTTALRHSAKTLMHFEDSFSRELSQGARDYVEILKASIARSEALAADALSIATMSDAHKRFRDVSLAKVVSVAADDIGLKCASSKHIKFQIEALPDVKADRNLLSVMLRELFENCFAHSGVEELSIRVRSQTHSDQYEISIEDNGVGFPKQIIDLFADKSSEWMSDLTGQSGGGLAICRSICAQHGAGLFVDPGCRTGAKVVIRWPVQMDAVPTG